MQERDTKDSMDASCEAARDAIQEAGGILARSMVAYLEHIEEKNGKLSALDVSRAQYNTAAHQLMTAGRFMPGIKALATEIRDNTRADVAAFSKIPDQEVWYDPYDKVTADITGRVQKWHQRIDARCQTL